MNHLRYFIQTEKRFHGPYFDVRMAKTDGDEEIKLVNDDLDEAIDSCRKQGISVKNAVNIDEERQIAFLYRRLVGYAQKQAEAETTLAQDMELLCSDDLNDWRMRFAIIYRIERKKILQSQLHLLDWLDSVLRYIDRSPSLEVLPRFFQQLSFKKTAFEEILLNPNSNFSDDMRYKYEEDYFLRRIYAANYLK